MKRIVLLSSLLLSPFSLLSQAWHWQNPLPQGNTLNGVHFVDSVTGWAVGVHGTILHTTNRGFSWGVQSSGTTDDLTSVYFTGPTLGWAVGGYAIAGGFSTILQTTDGGTTWNVQSRGATDATLNSVCRLPLVQDHP